MPVSAAELLAITDLGLRLVAGDPAAAVRWAHPVDLADPTPWLEGGELVLTTGLGQPRSAAAQRAYVARLAAAGVAGIGFGIGLGHARIPPALVTECGKRGLLLVEVPLPTPFLAITQAVAELLARQANAAVRRALDHQQRMARAALDNGVAGIVRSLAKALDADVAVTDAHHRLLAAAPGDGTDLIARATAELGALSSGPLGLSVSAGDDHLIVQTLGVGPTRKGLLAVATGHALLHADQLLLTHASSLLSLELERPRELVEAHRGLREAVLRVLLDGDLPAEVAHRPLRHLGFAPDDRLIAVVVRAGTTRDVARRLDELGGRPYLLTDRPEGVAVVVRADDEHRVLTALAGPDRALGASGTTDAAGLPAALRAAAHAAAHAAGRSPSGRVTRFADLRLTALLGQEPVRGAVEHLAGDLLTPLAEHPDLVHSLDLFLHANGSWETASRQLGVHRHTLRHRMARVSELTGADLESAQDRAALLLALLSRRL